MRTGGRGGGRAATMMAGGSRRSGSHAPLLRDRCRDRGTLSINKFLRSLKLLQLGYRSLDGSPALP
jgi:hypothetical protein